MSVLRAKERIYESMSERKERHQEHQPTPTDLLFVEQHEENIYFGELAKGGKNTMIYFIT